MSGGYSNGNGAAGATSTKGKKKRTGKKKTSGSNALVKNKLSAPKYKMTEWRANSGERWSVGYAKMQEKMTHWGASMKLGFFTATHPVHPLRREAAKQAMINRKAAATERRIQKVSAAQGHAAAKRAKARETRAAKLNEAVR
ncbi:unnamed protein product [Calypogeia fissa]